MASMEELYNTIADIWDSYDMYRQEHADKYGEAEESPSTIEQIKRHFYYVEKNKAGGLIPKIKNKINLDLELKETDSPEERSDKLWLLEQIYVAEKIGVYLYSTKNTELPEREFLSRCKVLDIIANPKGMYVYNNYDDYDNEIMDAFETVYTNVRASVKNADEIENTVDAIYSGWFHINAFFCLGICTGSVFEDKLSEMKKQRDAVEKIAFDPSRILSTPKNGKGVDSDTAETQEPQTYSNLKERFFIMLVTAQKRAEINDMLLGTFDYTKEKVLADRVMDIRVLKEFGKNELYKKEISFEEFTELLRFGSDEDKLCLWRGITSKYAPEIPGKEFFQSRGEFSKIIKYMKNIEEPITSSHDVKRAVTQWCLLFKIVYDGLQFEQKLISYNWEGKKVLKTMSSIFKSYNADRNVKSLSDDPHSRRKEREDRKEMHSAAILHQFTWDCIAQMHSSPEITDCKNAIKKKMLLVMQETFSCKLQTLDDIRKANYTMQFVFLMDSFHDSFLWMYNSCFNIVFWTKTRSFGMRIMQNEYPGINKYPVNLIMQQDYGVLFRNIAVKRKLLSILTAQSINQGDSRPFQALEFVATELGWSVVESSQIDPVVSCEKRIWARLFSYMTVHAKLRFIVNHINKTVTIDDCIFEEPYEQELRQYL